MTMGAMLRALKRLIPRFPTLQASYDAAQHVRAEGKMLRDMTEHEDDYVAQPPNGRHQAKFIRQIDAFDFPGDRPAESAATAVIVDKSGHWLGGRLCVRKVISELKPMLEQAKTLPVPIRGPRGDTIWVCPTE